MDLASALKLGLTLVAVATEKYYKLSFNISLLIIGLMGSSPNRTGFAKNKLYFRDGSLP